MQGITHSITGKEIVQVLHKRDNAALHTPYPLRYPLLLSRDKRLSVHNPLALSMYDSHGDSTSR